MSSLCPTTPASVSIVPGAKSLAECAGTVVTVTAVPLLDEAEAVTVDTHVANPAPLAPHHRLQALPVVVAVVVVAPLPPALVARATMADMSVPTNSISKTVD